MITVIPIRKNTGYNRYKIEMVHSCNVCYTKQIKGEINIVMDLNVACDVCIAKKSYAKHLNMDKYVQRNDDYGISRRKVCQEK